MKTNNGDLPAMPVTLNQAVIDAMRLANETGSRGVLTTMFGLTKREQFAAGAPEAPSWFKSYLYKNDLHYRQAEKGDAAEVGVICFLRGAHTTPTHY